MIPNLSAKEPKYNFVWPYPYLKIDTIEKINFATTIFAIANTDPKANEESQRFQNLSPTSALKCLACLDTFYPNKAITLMKSLISLH